MPRVAKPDTQTPPSTTFHAPSRQTRHPDPAQRHVSCPLDADGKEFPALAATRSSGVWRKLPSHDSGRDFGLVLLTGVNAYPSAVAVLDEFETKILKDLAS